MATEFWGALQSQFQGQGAAHYYRLHDESIKLLFWLWILFL